MAHAVQRQPALFEDRTVGEPPRPMEAPAVALRDKLVRMGPKDSRLKDVPITIKSKALAFYALGGRLFIAREEPVHNSLTGSGEATKRIACSMFELRGAGERLVVSGGVFPLTQLDRSFFNYKNGLAGEDERRCAELTVSSSEESLGRPEDRGKGFATSLTKLLMEVASFRGLKALYAKVEFEDGVRRLGEHGQASGHILKKLGFDHYATTDRAELYRKTL